MQRLTLRLARHLSCVAVFALAACGGGGDSAPAKVTAPDTLADLLPAGAVGVLYVHSLDSLAASISELAGLSDDPLPFPRDPAQLLGLMGAPGDTSTIERDRPLAVAILAEPVPAPAFVLPVRDAKAFANRIQGATARGGYVLAGASPGGGSASALVKDLPAGQLVLRLDVQALAPLLEPAAMGGLAMAASQAPPTPGVELGALFEGMGDALADFFDSARRLDVSVGYAGGTLTVDSRLTLEPGSALAEWSGPGDTGFAELAGSVDGTAPMVVYGGVDPALMRDKVLPLARSLLEVYPQPMRASLDAMIDKAGPLYASMGSAFAGAQSFGEGGLRYEYLFAPDDPDAFIDAVVTLLADPSLAFLGYEVGAPQTSEVGGLQRIRVPLTIDFEKMSAALGADEQLGAADLEEMTAMMQGFLGEDAALELARKKDRVVMTFGGGEGVLAGAAARLAKPSAPPAELGRLLSRFEAADPAMIVRVDLAGLMRSMPAFMPDMGEVPAVPVGKEAAMLFWAVAQDGDVFMGGTIDLRGMMEMIESMGR